ncbi:MAG: ATP-binding cassette domain-containing protein, partial [Dehalococcoidia bacterium]
MLLEVNELCQRFGNSDILKGINLEVERGETFVIVGPTGSGKSTLLRLIGLLDKPASGTIRFGGREVPDSARARLELRRRMAIVFQRPAVFNAT